MVKRGVNIKEETIRAELDGDRGPPFSSQDEPRVTVTTDLNGYQQIRETI